MSKIVVTQPMGLTRIQVDTLKSLGDLTYYDTVSSSTEEWLKRVKSANIIYSNIQGLDEGWRSIKNAFLTLPFVGASFMDIDILKINKVLCSNSPGCNQIAVTEWIVAMLLNYSRRFPDFIKTSQIKETKPVITKGIYGKIICIIGKGNIGSRAGTALEALGMKVNYYSRGDSLKDKTHDADFILDCISYSPTNRNFYDEEFFQNTKTGAVFMAISRNETQDLSLILQRLDSGKLQHFITDNASAIIFDETDETYQKLTKHTKVTVTPHIAAYSDTTVATASQICIENIKAYLSGSPINLIYK